MVPLFPKNYKKNWIPNRKSAPSTVTINSRLVFFLSPSFRHCAGNHILFLRKNVTFQKFMTNSTHVKAIKVFFPLKVHSLSKGSVYSNASHANQLSHASPLPYNGYILLSTLLHIAIHDCLG